MHFEAAPANAGAFRNVAAILAVTALFFAPPLARAQESGEVQACYVPGSGTIYRVAAPGLPADCLATGHVRFAWNPLSVAGGDLAGSFPNPVVARLHGREIAETTPAEGQVLVFTEGTWAPATPAGGATEHGALSGLDQDDHTQYLRADGGRALAGNLDAAGFRVTGLAAATAAGQAVRYEQAVKTGDAAGGDLAGSFPAPTVTRLRGRTLAATAPTAGQVLTFNGTAWAPATPATGVTAHSQLSGLTNDDHPQYLLAGGVRDVRNPLVFTGLLTSGGNLQTSGAGVRMIWYPRKAALRAGAVDGSQWDDANIGIHSVALGHRTTASAEDATALGSGSTAAGRRSFAAGWAATASGDNSVALGNQTTASGENAMAIGRTGAASGNNSIVLGHNSIASGSSSIALGLGTTASGSSALAAGNSTVASGSVATAMGSQTTASGLVSTALGWITTASGNYTTAMGSNASTNNQQGSFVYGDRSTLSAVNATRQNQFVVRAQHFWLGTNNSVSNPAGHFLTTSTGAHLTTGGAWTNSSDVHRKSGFEPLDAESVLDRLARLPVHGWSYRDEPGVRHVGPTAQDFYAAFGLGGSETTIATVDADGITMLAIQALERRTRELHARTAELQELREEVAALRGELARLEARLLERVR
jgi:hypothetical protein